VIVSLLVDIYPMTTTERIQALHAHIQSEAQAMHCRFFFVSYFDNGSGNDSHQGPSESLSSGLPCQHHELLTKTSFYWLDRACNFHVPLNHD